MYQKLVMLLLPYTRKELPGWGKLLKITKVLSYTNENKRWKNAPIKVIKGKWHGYEMQLHLDDWSERITFFLGRYYELGVLQLLNIALKPGDRFIDIGANIGMITLHAAHIVTSYGTVQSFEPNPEALKRLTCNLEINDIDHVKVHSVALSDTVGKCYLNFTSTHSGTATLANVNNIKKHFEVQVMVGDDIILADQNPVKLIKIDVEGFELFTLKGLKKTLEKFHPLLITEFIESHFVRAGTTSTEIESFLRDLNYKPYGISLHRKFFKYKLQLIPLNKVGEYNDIFWVHESDQEHKANKYNFL